MDQIVLLIIFIFLIIIYILNIKHKKTKINKVAICFIGLCRTTNYTITSIEKYIYRALDKLNIKYDIYLHTYEINKEYNNEWSNEKNVKINNDNWKLLRPNQYIIENEDEVSINLDLFKYRTMGDPWNTKFISLDNVILSLWSAYQVTQLWKNSNIDYDAVIYLRPDILYLKPLEPEFFNKIYENNILLPDFEEFPINDRFAIGNPRVMQIYGERFINAYSYSLSKQLHAESYLNYILNINNIIIDKIHFRFCRIRMDGSNADKKYFLEDYKNILD
jgi:hypothetical protein